MPLLKKRNCPECGGEMHPRLINLLYKKEKCEIQVDVIGIPANVCTKCFYRIIPGKIAKYIDSLVDPIFESEIGQQEKNTSCATCRYSVSTGGKRILLLIFNTSGYSCNSRVVSAA